MPNVFQRVQVWRIRRMIENLPVLALKKSNHLVNSVYRTIVLHKHQVGNLGVRTVQVIQQAIEVLLPGKRIVDQKYFGAGIVLHIAPAIDSDRCDVRRMIHQVLPGHTDRLAFA